MSQDAIPLSRPDVTEAEIQAVVEVMRTDRLSIGPKLEAFEAAVAGRAGRKFGVGVNSGTSGLHLCLRALGIGEGDEVITTSFSFIATTNCILFQRAVPVFVDIDPDTYNMDPGAIAAAVTARTRAVLPAEIFGNTAHFDRYEQIASEHGLMLIEDSCEALGGYLGSRPSGSFGQCGVFAFYPNKQITTGEGGMIVTDRSDIRDLCVSMRNQGTGSARLRHERLGYNYRMHEMSAAMGIVQMQRLDEILARRRQVAAAYDEALADVEEIHLPPRPAGPDKEKASWFLYVIRLADQFSNDERQVILAELRRKGISAEAYFHPIHLQQFVQERFASRTGPLSVCEHVAARTIALPFFTSMTPEHVHRVADALRSALARCRSVAPDPVPPIPPSPDS